MHLALNKRGARPLKGMVEASLGNGCDAVKALDGDISEAFRLIGGTYCSIILGLIFFVLSAHSAAASQIQDVMPGNSGIARPLDSVASVAQPQSIYQAPMQSQGRSSGLEQQGRLLPDQISNGDQSSVTVRDAPATGAVIYRGVDHDVSEFEAFSSEIAGTTLRRFGSNFLLPIARDYTVAPTTAVPPDYRLNAGDEIIVGLTGSVETSSLTLTLDSEGRVFMPRVGAITLGGVPYRNVSAIITRRLANQYNNFTIAVSMGRLHGITIFMTGYANAPGSYTLGSLSTLVNAVMASGGPSVGGSFRSIQVRRRGTVIADFDLYDLILKGDKSQDISLQNEDVVYISAAGPQVAVFGSVNMQAVFEAKPGETVHTVLRYAGGANTVADDSRVLLFDPLFNDPRGWKQILPSSTTTMAVERGQIIQFLSGIGLSRSLNNQPALVAVSGEVNNPGRFFLPPNATLKDALNSAGGLTDRAYTKGTVFTRKSVRDMQRASQERTIAEAQFLLMALPLTTGDAPQNYVSEAGTSAVRAVVNQLSLANNPDGRLVLSTDPMTGTLPMDMNLMNGDTIYVPAPSQTVGVFGFVTMPSVFQYAGSETQTIGDFIERAGGAQKIGDRIATYVVREDGSVLSFEHGLFRRKILSERARAGDKIFVPIDANRGEAWAKIGKAINAIFLGSFSAAAVKSVSK
jgi:polysaccharide export outer membrane protein